MEDTRQQPPRIVRLGDAAPDFQARSTMGDVRLSGYRGKWLIFFSHPADFTPVCSTEFVALLREEPVPTTSPTYLQRRGGAEELRREG